jgi:hypothetical protein
MILFNPNQFPKTSPLMPQWEASILFIPPDGKPWRALTPNPIQTMASMINASGKAGLTLPASQNKREVGGGGPVPFSWQDLASYVC